MAGKKRIEVLERTLRDIDKIVDERLLLSIRQLRDLDAANDAADLIKLTINLVLEVPATAQPALINQGDIHAARLP